MKNISLTNIIETIVRLVRRYNMLIFTLSVAGGLIFAILTLNGILTQPYNSTSSTKTNTVTNNTTTYDQTTINELSKLDTSAKNTVYQTIPSGRINPFSE